MSQLPNVASGVCVHIGKVPDAELWRLSIYLDGAVIARHTLQKSEIGTMTLSGLAQALDGYVGSSSAVQGAIAWQSVALVPSKQEARQLVGWGTWLWRLLRAFLP